MLQKIHFILFITILSQLTWGQQPIIETSVDSTSIKIGQQINLFLKTTVAKNTTVAFPERNTFGALEVIASYPVDTLTKDQNIQLIKRYGLTQFDSGKYVIPRLSVVVNNHSYVSDSIAVEVRNVAVDTLKQKLYDIKSIIVVESKSNYNWLWYLLLIPGIIIIYFLLKSYKPKPIEVEEVFTSPIEKATALLSRLEEKKLWQKGEYKPYYSELTEIIRIYIEEAVKVPAMESTTSEVISGLEKAFKAQKANLSKETLSNLKTVLQNADLVKFAKSTPAESDIIVDKTITEKVIQTIDQSIPKIIEEEIIEEDKIKKEKQPFFTKRRLIIGSVCLIISLYVGLGILFYTDGLDGISKLWGGKSSKKILESEWVTSEYGYPSIKIETPEVLLRNIITSETPNNPVQLFMYGTPDEEYSIVINSHPANADKPVDLAVVSEMAYAYFEKEGAQNILINEETFELAENIQGKKAFGSLSVPLSKDANPKYKRVRFEMLFFNQNNALQQIHVIYDDNNVYAEQIKQRIMKSVAIEQISK